MNEQECIQTFDGRHHFGPRKWLARDSRGRSLDPTVKGHWSEEWACVCGVLAPAQIIDRLKAGVQETGKVSSRRWGVEQAAQGGLL